WQVGARPRTALRNRISSGSTPVALLRHVSLTAALPCKRNRRAGGVTRIEVATRGQIAATLPDRADPAGDTRGLVSRPRLDLERSSNRKSQYVLGQDVRRMRPDRAQARRRPGIAPALSRAERFGTTERGSGSLGRERHVNGGDSSPPSSLRLFHWCDGVVTTKRGSESGST